MKATVLMWLMPQWTLYRWVAYLCPVAAPKASESVYKLELNLTETLMARLTDGVWKRSLLFEPERVSEIEPSSILVRLVCSRQFSFSIGVSRYFSCALRDWPILVHPWRLSSIFMRFFQFSCVVADFFRFSSALGGSRQCWYILLAVEKKRREEEKNKKPVTSLCLPTHRSHLTLPLLDS